MSPEARGPEDRSSQETAEGHGVAGTQRGDSRMEEEPTAPDDPESPDVKEWGSATETGGEATSSD